MPKTLGGQGAPWPFDYLVLAAGVTARYVGIPGAAEHTFPLYSLPDALRVRTQILDCFEAAERQPALVDEGLLTFVVVGGGPTGVETAGALADLFLYINLGTMATIGRGEAVCEFPRGLTLQGSLAWIAWLGVHLTELSGIRNRLDVLTDWGWGILTHERAARISIDPLELEGRRRGQPV